MKLIVALFLLLLVSVARAQGDLSSRITQIYEEELEEALSFAPPGKSKYQLRGDAQFLAQSLLDKLARENGYPPYKIGGILYKPVIIVDRFWDAAATAAACDYPPYGITINEILFYRNYDYFMREAIPHEVAHIAACLKGNNHGDDHGPAWEAAMIALGFSNPQNMTGHDLDMIPVERYRERVREVLSEAFNAQAN